MHSYKMLLFLDNKILKTALTSIFFNETINLIFLKVMLTEYALTGLTRRKNFQQSDFFVIFRKTL
jgi:hypothetical protein